MKNLVFVLWMLGYPLINMVSNYVFFVLRKEVATDAVKGFSAIIQLIVWGYIGYLLFEK